MSLAAHRRNPFTLLSHAEQEALVLDAGRARIARGETATQAGIARDLAAPSWTIGPVVQRLRATGRCPWPVYSAAGRPIKVGRARHRPYQDRSRPVGLESYQAIASLWLEPARPRPRSRGDDPEVIAQVKSYVAEMRSVRRRRPEWWSHRRTP